MRILLATLAIFCCLTLPYAQDTKVKFGKVTKQEFDTPEFDDYEAVVLFDKGLTDFKYNTAESRFEFVFKRHVRIKINNPNGYDWADVRVRVYDKAGSSEQVGGVKGFTHKLIDGKVEKIKMLNTAMFDEKINDFWKYRKFTLPEVTEGDIIEYQYTVTSQFLYNLRSWTFQRNIPVKWSEYTLITPEYFTYNRFVSGFLGMTANETSNSTATRNITVRGGNMSKPSQTERYEDNYRTTKERFLMTDIPAFVAEPFISTMENYISTIDFELQSVQYPGQVRQFYAKSWESLNNEFMESGRLGRAPNNVGFLKDEVEAIKAKYPDKMQLMLAINNFVRNSFEWDEFVGTSTTTTLRQAFNKQRGNVADINLTLVGMLRLAGFKTEIVLLSTRSNGIIRPQFPLSEKLNYVIAAVEVDGNTFFLDAVDKTVPSGFLPERCYNGTSLLISEAGHKLFQLTPSVLKNRTMVAMLTLSEDAELSGDIRINSSNYYGFPILRNVKTRGEEDYVERFNENKQNWSITEHEVVINEDPSKPIINKLKVESMEVVDAAGDLVYINPILNEGFSENPFNLEERKYPVDFNVPFANNYTVVITVDPAFIVEEIPESISFVLPDKSGMYIFSCAHKGNQIQIQSKLQLRKQMYTQFEYGDLREFFSTMVNKQSEPIVLKRK